MSALQSARAKGVIGAVVLLVGLTGMQPVFGQSTTVMGFVPGARTIVNLDFAATAIGDFPKGLQLLQGSMEVVDKNGMHMLRASSPSEFVLQLPEALPPKFTLEFELIPKTCCNPVDLMVEGVISGSRSSVSAQLEWHPGHFAVVGGNPTMFQMDMPAAIAGTLPAQLTQVAVSFDDETVKMYTNGRRLYTLADRKFVRGRVLRISLGGQDDDKYAVYLARVRVADAATTSTVASSQSAMTGSGLTNTLNGATLTTSGGGSVPVSTSAPTSTTVTAPSGPGTSAGPLPAGTVAPTPAQTAATQPAPLSSPTNPLPTVTSGSTAQQQNASLAQPRGTTSATATAPIAAGAGPVASSSGLAGPTEFYANLWGANTGWGVVLKWSPVAGATSYRVSRTGPGVPATPITVINLPFALGAGTWVYALDADVDQTTDYTYWVEGVTVSGALTNPSPVSSVRTGSPPTVLNLRASVAGTTQVTIPGSFGAAGPAQGSNVTWTWDALPLVYSYEISYQLVGTAGQVRKTLFTTVTPSPAVSPISFGVPQGATVYFCVSVWGSNDPLKSLPTTTSTCLATQVP